MKTLLLSLLRRSTMAFATQVLRCDPSSISFSASDVPDITCQETLQALQRASQNLHDLQTVAFPTETVYGLGALALNPIAASRIFSTKGRPPDNPLIVHVSSLAMLHSLLPQNYVVPRICNILIKHFWPGPLTLLFPSNPSVIPPVITANQPTVAVRMPSHPVARALISITGAPIAAPSANSSGKPSPTRAEHVLRDLGRKVSLILDGGPCEVGLESTVVDALRDDGNIRVLRPGGVTVEDLERVVRQEMADHASVPKVLVHRRDFQDAEVEQAPTTPGMKYRHYSPTVPVILLRTSSSPPSGEKPLRFASFLDTLKSRTPDGQHVLKAGLLAPSDSPLFTGITAFDGIEWHPFPLGPLHDPAVSAQRLFDGLLTLDNAGVDIILIEELKEEREGLAVMNRVKKAAGEVVRIDLGQLLNPTR
ncbi:Threonylcarbamoyl-AMP synthase [Sparassis crispa]|uniref:Threonylcarbamoyl-AMP synthase n=1 Tax=Sparassis crispa TaxID=139825 RepID=A0A401GB99_9APHY|nr:Threonylcarbamoyl-AMP synthase [Sparassis crispa]GBE79421.1 Threonylcarbamoyl-AMP synthase [Sparassis crispa]